MDIKYRCAICSKLYDTVEERAKCELNCSRDVNKRKAEKEKRINELREARRLYDRELQECIRDYGASVPEDIMIAYLGF